MSSPLDTIKKLRPVAKTEEEADEEKMLFFDLPRKKCNQIVPMLTKLNETTKKSDYQHEMHLLKRILKKARVKDIDKALKHMQELDASEKIVPAGEVSKRLYNEIFLSRDFDLYGRPMPSVLHEPRRFLELKVLANNLGIEFTQKLDESKIEVEVEPPNEDAMVINHSDLITEKWKIGRKEKYNPPVGLSSNPSEPFRSLGNEHYFSYDGHWNKGRMDGMGTYLFRDGFTYQGSFEEGERDGEGNSTYPDGQRHSGKWKKGRYEGRGNLTLAGGSSYEGDFEFGRRHGHGTLTYPSGLVYTGQFVDGRPHGRGKMVSKLTGWAFDGSFIKGSISGSGTLITPPPDNKRHVYYWAPTKEEVTLPSIVRAFLQDQSIERTNRELKKREMYGALRGAQLKTYVNDIRKDLYELRNKEKKQRYLENVVKAKEQKKKLYEARLKALAGDEDP